MVLQAVSQLLTSRPVIAGAPFPRLAPVKAPADPQPVYTSDKVSFTSFPFADAQRWLLDAMVQILYHTEAGKKLSNLDIRPAPFKGYYLSGRYQTSLLGHTPFRMQIIFSATPESLYISIDDAYATPLNLPFKWMAAHKLKRHLSEKIPGVYHSTWSQVGIVIRALSPEVQMAIHYMRKFGLLNTFAG